MLCMFEIVSGLQSQYKYISSTTNLFLEKVEKICELFCILNE